VTSPGSRLRASSQQGRSIVASPAVACGSSMSIPRVGALKGRRTSWEVDRRTRVVRWIRGRWSDDDRRSLRENERSREETTRSHKAGGYLGREYAMVQRAKGVGGAAKPHERLPFEVDTLKTHNTPRRVARSSGDTRLGARRPGVPTSIDHRVISEEATRNP
jgi:hypothetical protein